MASKKKSAKFNLVGKIKKNPWKLTTFVFGVLAIILLASLFVFDGGLSSKQAGENFVDYFNSMGAQIEYVDSVDLGDYLYQVTILATGEDGNSREIPVYVTKDGSYYSSGIMPLIQEEVAPVQQEPAAPQGVVKSDKPLVQLFVMTHCPYGTQAEKGFTPAMRALSEVADLEIRFVHYYMHEDYCDLNGNGGLDLQEELDTSEGDCLSLGNWMGQEPTETPRQVCIREEQSNKFISYLECFLGKTRTQDDAVACELEMGIDSVALAECIVTGRAEEYYAEDSALSQAAGVQGSPTLVVNGVIISAGRNPQAYGDITCQAFNSVPELCGTVSLDSTTPSPGFGYSATGSATTAQC